MIRKQNLPRVRRMREMHELDLFNRTPYPGVPYFSLVKRRPAAFAHVLAMDPTPKAIYLHVVVKWMLNRFIRHEDARRIRDLLGIFHARKHALPEHMRDIGRYQTPGDLEEALLGAPDTRIRPIPDDVLFLAPAVAAGPNWAIHRVTETSAATWFADATSWCTRHPSTAQRYLDQGPLYVVLANGAKFQFHVRSGQFADRYDRPVLDLTVLESDVLEAIEQILAGTPEYRPCDTDFKVAMALLFDDPAKPLPPTNSWVSSRGTALRPDIGNAIETYRLINGRYQPQERIDIKTLAAALQQEDSILVDFLRAGLQSIPSHGECGVCEENEIGIAAAWLGIPLRELRIYRAADWCNVVWRRPASKDAPATTHVLSPNALPHRRIREGDALRVDPSDYENGPRP